MLDQRNDFCQTNTAHRLESVSPLVPAKRAKYAGNTEDVRCVTVIRRIHVRQHTSRPIEAAGSLGFALN